MESDIDYWRKNCICENTERFLIGLYFLAITICNSNDIIHFHDKEVFWR